MAKGRSLAREIDRNEQALREGEHDHAAEMAETVKLGEAIEADAIPEDVEQILREIKADASRAQLYVRSKETGKLAYVRAYDADEFDLEMVRKVWGGGEYQVRFIKPDGSYLTARTFEVFGDPKSGPNAPEPVPQASGPEQLFSGPSGNAFIELLRMHTDSMARLAERNNAANPIELAMGISRFLMEQMSQVASVAQDRSGEKMGFSEMLQIFEMGMEMGQGSSGTNMMIAKLGEAVLGHLNEARTREGYGPLLAGGGGGGGGAPRPAAQAPQQGAQSTGAEWQQLAQFWMPTLIEKARAGSDPGLYAEFILDNTPPHIARQLYEQLRTNEQFTAQLAEAFPEVKQHSQWFSRLFTEYVNIFEGGDKDEDDQSEAGQPVPGEDVQGEGLVGGDGIANQDGAPGHGPGGSEDA